MFLLFHLTFAVGTASTSHESRSNEMSSTAKRKRGRPKGSKNRTINEHSPTLVSLKQSALQPSHVILENKNPYV